VQCVPCIVALPHAQELYDKYKKDGLVVIGVCDDWGSEAQARRLLKEHNLTFPNLMDQNLKIASFQDGATVWNYVPEAGIPCYALIDRAGNLSWKSAGAEMPTAAQIEALLKQAGK
jgi:peroxiredoxin